MSHEDDRGYNNNLNTTCVLAINSNLLQDQLGKTYPMPHGKFGFLLSKTYRLCYEVTIRIEHVAPLAPKIFTQN